jgi:hypothetical protein
VLISYLEAVSYPWVCPMNASKGLEVQFFLSLFFAFAHVVKWQCKSGVRLRSAVPLAASDQFLQIAHASGFPPVVCIGEVAILPLISELPRQQQKW